MLISPTVDALHALNLGGMARALTEQRESPEYAALTFEERLGLLVDREALDRSNRRLDATSRRPSCAPPPAWRTSTSTGLAASIAR